eukprot:gene11995-12139_t
MSQVASLAWSTARLSLLAKTQLQQQHGGEASLQQQQQQVLQYVERCLVDNAGAAGSSPSSVVNIAWAMRRLGERERQPRFNLVVILLSRRHNGSAAAWDSCFAVVQNPFLLPSAVGRIKPLSSGFHVTGQ